MDEQERRLLKEGVYETFVEPPSPRKAPSADLLAAQEHLNHIRQQHQANQFPHGRSPEEYVTPVGSRSQTKISIKTILQQLPSHLGWESQVLTRVLARTVNNDRRPTANDRQPVVDNQRHTTSTPHHPYSSIKLYPSLALAMLRQDHVAPGRVWLLLQLIDDNHCGWVPIDIARKQLTNQDSAFRLCGRRQLRKLLTRGDGLFWNRAGGRIWLRSVAKVAASMDVYHLAGHPVSLPVPILTQGIGAVRAHFYASFHSGRKQASKQNGNQHPLGAPISRATLQAISHVSRRTQRNYEKRSGVRRRQNFAIGEKHSVTTEQQRAWQHGRAIFRFTDHAGKTGPKGATYTAWQLPNIYCGPHPQQSKGRQKRINRDLTDLFMKGMTGTGIDPVNGHQTGSRRFYDNGLLAAASYSRSPDKDAYWPTLPNNHGNAQFWHILPAKKDR